MTTTPERDGNRYLSIDAFDEHVRRLEADVRVAAALSQHLSGIKVDARRSWASILFTRICSSGFSLLKVVPRTLYNTAEGSLHWDFSATAALSRNIFECCLFFYYLCVEDVGEAEVMARLHLINLHDCTSRVRLFQQDSEMALDVASDLPMLRERLLQNAFFSGLPEKQQKRFLSGEHASFQSQDEILERMGLDLPSFRMMYRFMSAHTHTLPIAFHRMREDSRGRGIETPLERSRIGLLLPIVGDWIRRAGAQMQTLFPHSVGPHRPPRATRRGREHSVRR